MRDTISRISTLAKRNLKETIRSPLSLIFTIAMPLFMEILFYYLFHSDEVNQFEMKYLAPGIVVFSQAFLTLFSGLLISMDKGTAFLTRLYVSKAKSYEFIFGYALSMIPISFVQSVLFFVVGGIIDPSIFKIGTIWAILLSLFTSLFFIAAGILFGSICNEKSIGGVSSILISGQSLLSGMWFPIDKLNENVITLMKCLPFKNFNDAMYYVMNGTNDVVNDIVIPLLIAGAYTVIMFILAPIAFKKKMKEN